MCSYVHEYRMTCGAAISLMSQYAHQLQFIHEERAHFQHANSSGNSSSSGSSGGGRSMPWSFNKKHANNSSKNSSNMLLKLNSGEESTNRKVMNMLEGELKGFHGEDEDSDDEDEEEDAIFQTSSNKSGFGYEAKELLDGETEDWDEALKVFTIIHICLDFLLFN
jgi:hypothetical protein